MDKASWISSRLCCGLGNRLFQITAAIGAAERNKTEPILFLPAMYKVEHANFDLIKVLCPNLRLIETVSEWEILGQTQEATVPRIKTTSPVVLHGFFQNTANFPDLTNKYLPRLPDPLLPTTAWAVHFRFGDYRILPHHQIPGLNKYYYHAITQYIPKGSTIILFSDSPELLKPISEEINQLGYVCEPFISTNTLDTFKVFASCSSGSICSNSTFAWWAAFLTYQSIKNLNYKAFFPDTWLHNQPSPKIFTLPFTQALNLQDIPNTPYLKSFHY
jgi:hypothetical protein